MDKSKIILFEQETRNNKKYKEIPEIIKIIKMNQLKMNTIYFLSLFISCILIYLLRYTEIAVFLSMFIFLYSMVFFAEYTNNKYTLKLKKIKEFIFNRYGLDIEDSKLSNINISVEDEIRKMSEKVMLDVEIENIEYSILFFSERYMYAENKEDILNNIEILRNKIKENKKLLLEKKKILASVSKELPYMSDIIDVSSLELTEEENKMEEENKEKEKELLMRENLKLELKVNTLRKKLEDSESTGINHLM